jgi:hypothetical protein
MAVPKVSTAGPGRSSPQGLLDDDLIDEIGKLLRVGNYYVAVSAYIGIANGTLYAWMDRGRKAVEAATVEPDPDDPDGVPEFDMERVPERERRYAKLVQTIDKAEAEAEVRLVAQWGSGAQKDWKAAREMLRVKHPERWSDPESKVRVVGQTDNRHLHVHTAIPAAALTDDYRTAAILSALAEAGALPAGVLEAATVVSDSSPDDGLHEDTSDSETGGLPVFDV